MFLLFNKLSAHKKIIYDAFVKELGTTASVDLYIYDNDFRLFEKLISRALHHYSHYVIMSHFAGDYPEISGVLSKIPPEKLILLDRLVEGYDEDTTAVYQNFYGDILAVLENQKNHIENNYKRVFLVFPFGSYHPQDIVRGFKRAGVMIEKNVLDSKGRFPVRKGDLYITVEEAALVSLIKEIRAAGLEIGKDVGILSYNENPLKEVLADGISVISTAFETMGKTCARLIREHSRQQVENPFRLIKRKSF